MRDAASLTAFIEAGGLWRYTWISELPTRWLNELDHYLLEIGRYNALDYRDKTLADCWRILQDINTLGTRYFLPNIAISLTQTLLYRVLRHILNLLDAASAQETFDRLISVVETKPARSTRRCGNSRANCTLTRRSSPRAITTPPRSMRHSKARPRLPQRLPNSSRCTATAKWISTPTTRPGWKRRRPSSPKSR